MRPTLPDGRPRPPHEPSWRRASRARRSAVATLVLLAALAGAAAPPVAAAPQSAEPTTWVIVDAGTGEVLAGRDHHTARPPASTAKILTALTVVERLPPEAPVAVSELAANQPPTDVGMEAGDVWLVEDALAAILMESANDAAYALAEAAGGDLDGFAAAMQATADRIGMVDATAADPAGLDAEGEGFRGGPRMSAYDIAVATRNALAVPLLASLAQLPTHTFVDADGIERAFTAHNPMLPGGPQEYPGTTGFKTGFTDQAGRTFVATAERDGRQLIAVVLDTYDTAGWAAQLLDQGFQTEPGSGTGESLPEIAVSPWATRQADRTAFAAAARGTRPTATLTATPRGSSSDGSAADQAAAQGDGTPPPVDTSSAESAAAATPAGGEAAGEGGGGGSDLPRNAGLLSLLLFVAFVGLRRRAVRRQRARRLARRRATERAMQRGALPTVDGRPRTGTRTGSRPPRREGGHRPGTVPSTSHVRLHRIDD